MTHGMDSCETCLYQKQLDYCELNNKKLYGFCGNFTRLDKTTERPQGEWISVSERSPNRDGIFDMEELIYALEIGKPAYDGEDTNYNVATIEDAIAIIKKYADIRQKVEEFRRKTTLEKPIETPIELQAYLKELEAHERCLANQVLNIII